MGVGRQIGSAVRIELSAQCVLGNDLMVLEAFHEGKPLDVPDPWQRVRRGKPGHDCACDLRGDISGGNRDMWVPAIG
jgi:hypothetical protein